MLLIITCIFVAEKKKISIKDRIVRCISLSKQNQKTITMNFFKIQTSWSNAEFIVLKIAIATAFILVGGYFHHFFHHYLVPVLILFVITAIWAVYLWLKKMKSSK